MLADYVSISSPDHEPLSLLEPLEDQPVVANVGYLFHTNGDGRLPAEGPGVCLPRVVGAVGTGVAGSQLQNAESNVEMMVTKVGGDGNTPDVGGDSFDGAGVKDNGDGAAIVGDGGGANRSVLMWLGSNFDIVWVLLIRGMNWVKAGSFALCLLSFFIDKQLSFSSRDTLYLRIAFSCGLSAFFVAPWHVPNADATLRAQYMQEIAVLTLLMGVLTVMVTALDEGFRVLVLFSCIALVRVGRGLEED